MKTTLSGSRCRLLAFSLMLLCAETALAVPEYIFKNAVLESGTDLQAGAMYRFTAVKTGVDALVTITFITPGCSVTKIDNDGAGYQEAFQPEILVPNKMTGYAEFHIAFVATGTSIPMVMVEIPATAIDIDGNAGLWGGPMLEYDAISMGPGSYADFDNLGTQLSVNFSPGWLNVQNTGGVEYGGISISATAVMATTVNASATSFDYRTGVDNQSNIPNLPRQKSLYFMKITYPNSSLGIRCLNSFSGNTAAKDIALQWQLNHTEQLQRITLQKSEDGKTFTDCKVFYTPGIVAMASYTDEQPALYYRLEMTYTDGQTDYSRIVSFNRAALMQNKLSVKPCLLQSTALVSLLAGEAGAGELRLIDNSGRIVRKQSLLLQKGTNTFMLTKEANWPKGIYRVQVITIHQQFSSTLLIL